MRRCSRCREEKPVEGFYRCRRSRGGRKHACIDCEFDRGLRRLYGITAERFAEMWVEQEGRCAVCKGALRRGRGGYAVDHCHATGRARDLLCVPCNRAFGFLGEDPVRIQGLLEYAVKYLPQGL